MITVMSALTKLRPASTTRRYARLSKSRESASRQRGSVGGNICPMSPRPAAPRMASVRACATASASECPTSPREYGISTPPRISFLPSPSANRWESYPIPTRMSGVEDADREESGVLGVVDPDAGHRDAPGHLRPGDDHPEALRPGALHEVRGLVGLPVGGGHVELVRNARLAQDVEGGLDTRLVAFGADDNQHVGHSQAASSITL